MQVEIEKLVYGGDGLARADGRVILAPFVIPGEKVEVKPSRVQGSVDHSRVVEWIEKSPFRETPACPVFGVCGGCHYQHIPYEKQLEYKRAILMETIGRVGGIKWDGPVETVAGEPWGYRNRTQIRARKHNRRVEIGFFEAGSHRLVETPSCPINSPMLNRAHEALIAMSGERRFPGFLNTVELFTNESDIQLNVLDTGQPLSKSFFAWCREAIPGVAEADAIDYPSGGDSFRVGSRSFFQVNRFLTDALSQLAIGDAAGGTALDLYAGVGLFTLPLARRFETVQGVDSSWAATRALQFNAERAGVNVRVINLGVERFLADYPGSVDFAVADPPRAGLGKKVTVELLRIRPAVLSLVSCDPATLARDLQVLTAGGYGIEKITLIDLFPQTFHLETVVRLRRA